jgi:imidazole glycerol-phosphate synthase subunit HisF
MLEPRRIPVLQILNGKLVKTKKFKKPSYVGDPLNAVKIFNDKEVDELIITDITPERSQRGPDFKFIENLLSECQMPVGYGGGIRSAQDAQSIISSGAEKIILNTLAFENPDEVLSISETYGSQAISFSIDYKINILGNLCFYKNSGIQKVKVSVEEVIEISRYISCGEIILHNIKRDGMLSGYNYDLLNLVKDKIDVPVVLLGGAKSHDDFNQAIKHGAHSTAAGSFFIYQGPHKAVLIQY